MPVMNRMMIALTMCTVALSGSLDGAAAKQRPHKQATAPRATKALKRQATNPCSTYGPGFVQMAGTSTCIRIGGGIGIGAGF